MDVTRFTTPPADFFYSAHNDNDQQGPIRFAPEILALPSEVPLTERYVL